MRKPLNPLGQTEMEVLNEVWDLKEATVAEVQARIQTRRKVAYTTVMTVLKNLCEKGYLTYRKEGVTYVYSAARAASSVKSDLVEGLLDRAFGGAPLDLVQALVRRRPMTETERQQLRDVLDALDTNDQEGDDA
ncbi:MAG: BlaI/MecI/CopY family transcriptional regulator [Bacteroidota bacterium]